MVRRMPDDYVASHEDPACRWRADLSTDQQLVINSHHAIGFDWAYDVYCSYGNRRSTATVDVIATFITLRWCVCFMARRLLRRSSSMPSSVARAPTLPCRGSYLAHCARCHVLLTYARGACGAPLLPTRLAIFSSPPSELWAALGPPAHSTSPPNSWRVVWSRHRELPIPIESLNHVVT